MMSSIGFNDGQAHGYEAWGRMTMCCVGCIPGLRASFADMADAERFVMESRTSVPSGSQLNLIIARATILADKEGYFCDYATRDLKYNIVRSDAKGQMSFTIDRQHVVQGFLDLAEKSDGYDN